MSESTGPEKLHSLEWKGVSVGLVLFSPSHSPWKQISDGVLALRGVSLHRLEDFDEEWRETSGIIIRTTKCSSFTHCSSSHNDQHVYGYFCLCWRSSWVHIVRRLHECILWVSVHNAKRTHSQRHNWRWRMWEGTATETLRILYISKYFWRFPRGR